MSPAPSGCTGTSRCRCSAGDRFVGLVDPGRSGRTLVAKHVSLETRDAAGHVAAALEQAAAWVDCDDVVVERVTPPERRAELDGVVAAAVRG